ncbi:cyanophycinase [Pedobacter montanisoli]|uniref:Cyanophycinase n=1 Tax=Pedobacter montanisoli TaxID=2923277 RepID=A0ABS9ZWG3_9SPHI|nr:cyanophycinase [Pedobacter montanisoli]MCJ0742646.1 cyanophycinase [Pedobacter montanisoli]
MKKIYFLMVAFSLMSFLAFAQQTQKGKLFIIGGGTRSDALIKDLVNTAEFRANDYIIVLPMASEEPDTGFKYINQQLKKHTALKVRNFNFAKHDVNDSKWIDSLKKARMIYILGGDQSRFMKSVLNTPVYTAIHEAYKNGSTIAGTSAGAAVMSRYMITGKQLLESEYKETFNQLLDKNIEFSEGLGLLQNTIIDQHFIKRNRYNRLISALADKPTFTCVGIDEGTAIVVKGNQARVSGDSQVIRIANPVNLKTDRKLIKFSQVQFGLFTNGDVFEIKP